MTYIYLILIFLANIKGFGVSKSNTILILLIVPIFIINVMMSTRGVKTGTYANKYKTLTKKIGLIISLVSSMFLFIAFIYPEYLSQDALLVDAAFKREFEKGIH